MLGKTLVATAVLSLAAAGAWGAYATDFDDLTLGSINGQEGWSGAGTVQTTTVVSGQALQATDLVGRYSGIFDTPTSSYPQQRITFEFLFDSDINDFAGTPYVDIQHAFQFRGPDASQNNEFFLIYKAYTNDSGVVTKNDLEIRGSSGTLLKSGVEKDTWYQVTMDFDFGADSVDVEVKKEGAAWWDPAAVVGYNNGNVDHLIIGPDGDPDLDIFVDNYNEIGEVPGADIPEPATLALLGVGGLGLLARRRRGGI